MSRFSTAVRLLESVHARLDEDVNRFPQCGKPGWSWNTKAKQCKPLMTSPLDYEDHKHATRLSQAANESGDPKDHKAAMQAHEELVDIAREAGFEQLAIYHQKAAVFHADALSGRKPAKAPAHHDSLSDLIGKLKKIVW